MLLVTISSMNSTAYKNIRASCYLVKEKLLQGKAKPDRPRLKPIKVKLCFLYLNPSVGNFEMVNTFTYFELPWSMG